MRTWSVKPAWVESQLPIASPPRSCAGFPGTTSPSSISLPSTAHTAAHSPNGRIAVSDFATSDRPIQRFLKAGGANATHVIATNGETSAGRTAHELEGRRVVLRIYRFLRTLPGLENLRLDWVAAETGVRESVTIIGRESVTVDDYVSGRVWPDAVCHSFYPIDVHQPDGDGIDIRPLAFGVVPSIPRGALIPADHDYICVAGRSVAGDQEANSAYRVQATSMATGQAAGALAALSVHLDCGLSDVPQDRLRALLRRHGAIVPGPSPDTQPSSDHHVGDHTESAVS